MTDVLFPRYAATKPDLSTRKTADRLDNMT